MKYKNNREKGVRNYLYTKNRNHITGITLIALVVTIVLNCCKAAMERMLKNVNILKI